MACDGCSDPYCGDCSAREYLDALIEEQKRASRGDPSDEFLIVATTATITREWTRSSFPVAISHFVGKLPASQMPWKLGTYGAQDIARQAVYKLGFDKAVVYNIYGGHWSDVLFEMQGSKSI